jgi:hypothetical protein
LASIERHCLGVDLPPEVRFELDCHGRPHSYGRRGARSDSLRFRTDSLKPQSSSAALALLPWHGLAGLGTLIAFPLKGAGRLVRSPECRPLRRDCIRATA